MSYEDLGKIDNLTPVYREMMNNLPPNQRKIVASLVRYGRPVRICELAKIARIPQQNNVSSQVSRLTKKGLLEKTDNVYWISRKHSFLVKYLDARLNRRLPS